MRSETILLGLFVGFTAGVLIGILFAPAKGSTLRKNILNKGGNYSKTFMDKMDDFHESIPENFKIYKQKTESLTAEDKETL